ncbi:MAG: hypothetical protein IV100_16145 [Myxococcales bacterium]|nr:hypothetical protein [Myxococcales bacterium]
MWQWEVTGRTRRGTGTIAILKLDQNIDTISDHVRNNILPRVELVERSTGAGNPQQAVLDWNALLSDCIESPRAELRGPTFCALEYLVPSSTRQQNLLRSPLRP